MAASRLIAIGDIHGCLAALDALLTVIQPQANDTIVFLGDYVDRGPKCKEVLERLRSLKQQHHMIPLLGNHDEMLLNIYDGQADLYIDWLSFGGIATLESYDVARPEEIPAADIEFLKACPLYYETEQYFFVHGSYLADLPLAGQPRQTLLWESLKYRQPGPHYSGKIAIVGHTSQKSGRILDLGYLKCIDTRCYDAGWLTALDVASGHVWQADKYGRIQTQTP